MRKFLLIASLICSAVLIWAVFALALGGWLPSEYVRGLLPGLELPRSTSELGESMTIVEGMFSSLAVVFALIAVLLQGEELRKATDAQTTQANALVAQQEQQASSVALSACAIKLQFLLAERDRLEQDIQTLKSDAQGLDGAAAARKWDLIKNLNRRQLGYRRQAERISALMEAHLPDGYRTDDGA